MAEQMIEANGVELCTEPFGDPAHPPILLIMGTGASMLWWEEGLCQLLADGGRFVIRYDHRDTGRSVTYEPQRPGYSGADLVADAAGVLDAFGIPSAHLVGVSAGGAFAQLLALGRPNRVSSLVLISTSPALPGERELPPPTDEFGRFVSIAAVDWSDAESVIDYRVEYSRVLAGERRPFDEEPTRRLVRRDVKRARDFAAVQNHDVLPEGEFSSGTLSSITASTLVIHGTADPMFPIEHGKALAEEIPGARLLPLREPATAFIGPTGNGSPVPSSSTLPRAVGRSPDGSYASFAGKRESACVSARRSQGTSSRSAPRLDGMKAVHRHDVGGREAPAGRSSSTSALAMCDRRRWATFRAEVRCSPESSAPAGNGRCR